MQRLTSVNKDIKSRAYIVDKLHKEAGERDEKMKEIDKKVKDLEVKSIDLENKNFDFNTKFESFILNYQMQNRFVSGMKERLEEIEESREKDEERWKKIESKETEVKDESSRKELDKLIERVNGNDSLIDGLISKVKKISGEMKEGKKSPAFASGEDHQIEERVKGIEKVLARINEETTKGKNQGKDQNLALDFDIENRLKVLEKEVDDIKMSVPVGTAASNDGTTHSSINYNLKRKIDTLSKDNQEMKSAVLSCQQILNSKADFDQLHEIDKVVTDKLND